MSLTRFTIGLKKNQDYVTFPFLKNSLPLENAPLCGMSVRRAGSMRFRWNEVNERRNSFLKRLCAPNNLTPVPLELIHSKTVYDVREGGQTQGLQGDGMITSCKSLLPVVTVADCMPLYFYDDKSGVFGVVHSGWKGTGIIWDALELAKKNYGAVAKDFCVVIGAHIRGCCYIVNEERADYFVRNFGADCVQELEEGGVCLAGGRGLPFSWNSGSGKLYRLSLEKANLNVLEKCGVLEENIAVCSDCTCCNELLGSNRRETADFSANNPSATREELGKCFTVQAAFAGFL